MIKKHTDFGIGVEFERAVLTLERELTPNARNEAKRILDHALREFQRLLVEDPHGSNLKQRLQAFAEMIDRRARGEPVERIIGTAIFCDNEFAVVPDVIIPRVESEILVDLAITQTPPNGRILDLGTGTGAILISVLRHRSDTSGCGLDVSLAAVEVAQVNAIKNCVSDRCRFEVYDWFQPMRQPELFDLVVANPPYITTSELGSLAREIKEFDPIETLCGGDDGLESYRAILSQVSQMLKPQGWIGLELGWRPIREICELMATFGLERIQVHQKHHGYSRAAFGMLPSLRR